MRERPRLRIVRECALRGESAVVSGCVRLLSDQVVDEQLILVLGGSHARELLAAGLPDGQRYWLRVWAARGLLWVWQDTATSAIRAALKDDAWRVREMACKVVARHEVDVLVSRVPPLTVDPVPRVQRAARRALEVLTSTRA